MSTILDHEKYNGVFTPLRRIKSNFPALSSPEWKLPCEDYFILLSLQHPPVFEGWKFEESHYVTETLDPYIREGGSITDFESTPLPMVGKGLINTNLGILRFWRNSGRDYRKHVMRTVNKDLVARSTYLLTVRQCRVRQYFRWLWKMRDLVTE